MGLQCIFNITNQYNIDNIIAKIYYYKKFIFYLIIMRLNIYYSKTFLKLLLAYIAVSYFLFFGKAVHLSFSDDSLFSFKKFVMGVEVELILRDSSESHARKASEAAFAEMTRLDAIMSNWKENSEISEVNRSPEGKWIPVSKELFEVISRGLDISKSTGGAFDITVGKLLNLWGFYTSSPKKPLKEEIDNALKSVGYKLIELNPEKHSLFFKKPGIEIDLGGIAKGYILEKGFESLKGYGIKAGLINGSGDIYVWGEKPGDKLWNIAVEDPINREKPLTILSVTDTAIFTSGDYERRFIEEDGVFHHILDPKTGMPAGDCRGVTVIGKSINEVNGLSSAVFILGHEKGISFAEKLPNVEAVVSDADGKVILSKGFKKNYPDAILSR